MGRIEYIKYTTGRKVRTYRAKAPRFYIQTNTYGKTKKPMQRFRFPQFRRLPAELQAEVWFWAVRGAEEEALDKQSALKFGTALDYEVAVHWSIVKGLLHACHESREWLLYSPGKVFKWEFQTFISEVSQTSQEANVNPHRDFRPDFDFLLLDDQGALDKFLSSNDKDFKKMKRKLQAIVLCVDLATRETNELLAMVCDKRKMPQFKALLPAMEYPSCTHEAPGDYWVENMAVVDVDTGYGNLPHFQEAEDLSVRQAVERILDRALHVKGLRPIQVNDPCDDVDDEGEYLDEDEKELNKLNSYISTNKRRLPFDMEFAYFVVDSSMYYGGAGSCY